MFVYSSKFQGSNLNLYPIRSMVHTPIIWLICMVNVGNIYPSSPICIYDSRLQTSISQHLQAIGRLMACSKESFHRIFFWKMPGAKEMDLLFPQCFFGGEESGWKKRDRIWQPPSRCFKEFGPKESPVKCTTGVSFSSLRLRLPKHQLEGFESCFLIVGSQIINVWKLYAWAVHTTVGF